MEVIESQKLPGVKLIVPDVHEDHRGDYVMLYREDLPPYSEMPRFVEHCVSTSRKGVLRGIHADYECDKLIEVLHGEIYYVVVDCLETSPTFSRVESYILSGRNHHQVFKPARYGTGFLALTDDVVFHYLQSQPYDERRQVTWRWDDPRLKVWWPTRLPILSKRDVTGGRLW